MSTITVILLFLIFFVRFLLLLQIIFVVVIVVVAIDMPVVFAWFMNNFYCTLDNKAVVHELINVLISN